MMDWSQRETKHLSLNEGCAWGVIGRQGQVVLPFCPWLIFTPFRIWQNQGICSYIANWNTCSHVQFETAWPLQERKGMKIIIAKTRGDLCPISEMLNFLKVRGSYPGPLFCRMSGATLSKLRFVNSVRLALNKANLCTDAFAGHTYRIRAATIAAFAGIFDSSIQSLGHWKSNV